MTTNSTPKTQREISIERGKDIAIGLIAFIVLLEGLGLFIKIRNGQFISVVDVIRATLTIVLCAYFYKGRNWAKTLLALFVGFGAIIYTATLCRAIADSVTSFSFFVVILLMIVTSTISVYFLIFSHDIDEFMNSQKV